MNSAQVEHLLSLVRYFGELTRQKVGELFRGLAHNTDSAGYAVARQVME